MGDIGEILAVQTTPWNGLYEFKCGWCRSWRGGCRCGHNVFVAFEGANLAMCSLFEAEEDQDVLRERQKKRCGW